MWWSATISRWPHPRPRAVPPCGWAYEEKVDGWRIVAYKDRDRARLVSRHGVDHTKRFAGVAVAITKLSARTLVLDGEVAVYDQELRSRFDWLREPDRAAVAPRRRCTWPSTAVPGPPGPDRSPAP